jgi:hypothetical protein
MTHQQGISTEQFQALNTQSLPSPAAEFQTQQCPVECAVALWRILHLLIQGVPRRVLLVTIRFHPDSVAAAEATAPQQPRKRAGNK